MREIKQGDVFWILVEDGHGPEPGIPHPHVVVEDNAPNGSVMVCALTTNLKRATLPGNVLLDEGDANLPRRSVVVVSQVSTVGKSQLGDYIGSLSAERLKQITAGMYFVQRFTERQ